MVTVRTHSSEETFSWGFELGKTLSPGAVLCFYGDLGAGKTTLVKGLIVGATDTPAHLITSPTFTYLNIYGEQPVVYHFDLYRLGSEEEFEAMGFDEQLYAGGICCIEWPERIEKILPKEVLRIHLSYEDENSRVITLEEV